MMIRRRTNDVRRLVKRVLKNKHRNGLFPG